MNTRAWDDEVRYLLRTVIHEGRSLVRVEQPRRSDKALLQVASVTDAVQQFELSLERRPEEPARITAELRDFEQRYRAIEKALPQGDVLQMWIEGELSGRISDFVQGAGRSENPRR
jgi:hypothetical protein